MSQRPILTELVGAYVRARITGRFDRPGRHDCPMPSRDEREAAVLEIGGIDNAVIAMKLFRGFCRVHPAYVRFKLRWEEAKLEALGSFRDRSRSAALAPQTLLDETVSEFYGDRWSLGGRPVPYQDSHDEDVHLPGRNLLLLANTDDRCELRWIETIALGTPAFHPLPDSSTNYFESMGQALRLALRRRIELIRPFERESKSDVMNHVANLPIDVRLSCLDPREGCRCGSCNKCGERRRALRSVYWPDPTSFSTWPA